MTHLFHAVAQPGRQEVSRMRAITLGNEERSSAPELRCNRRRKLRRKAEKRCEAHDPAGVGPAGGWAK